MNKGGETALRTPAQWNMVGAVRGRCTLLFSMYRQTPQNPFVDVGPIGRVTILLDEPKLEAAGRELSTTRTVRVTHPIDGYNYNHCTRDKPIAGAPAPTGGATPPNDRAFVR